MSTETTAITADKTNALAMLRKFAPKGSTIYCVLRSVSKSGMSRRIDFFALQKADRKSGRDYIYPQYLTGWMSAAGLGSLRDGKQGMRVDGCGMDMGFHVVNNLSYTLYGTNTMQLRSEWI